MTEHKTTPYTVEGQVADARAGVGDITAEAQFCVSEIGVLRREDREIALASEVLRLRRGWLRVIQQENGCPATGGGCFAKRCGCVAEMEMLANE
jgi:hypothetical protein